MSFTKATDTLSTVSLMDVFADSVIVPSALRFKETFLFESFKRISLEIPVIDSAIVNEDSVVPLLLISTVLLCILRVLPSFFRDI